MAEEDQQQKKKAAALAYDYDSDPRWVEYWANVLIPENRPKSEVERHLKFKFYQRNIDPELKVESLSSTAGTSSSQRPSQSGERPRSSSSSTAQPRSSSTGTAQASARASVGSNGVRIDQQSIGFLSNALVIIMASLAMIPFAPYALSVKSYRFTFLGSLIASGHSIYLQYGRPRAMNMQAVQIWLQSVVAGKDFMYLLYSTVFISTVVPIKFAMIPVLCQALLNTAQHLKRNFGSTQIYRKYLEKACRWLETNSLKIRTMSANCEVGLGFFLIFLLLMPQKSLIQLLVYWQLLKLMYHAPPTASFHRSIWSRIGAKANPLIHQYAPILETPLRFAQRWFRN